MFKSKKWKTVAKLKKYLREWDTEQHGYVNVLSDGRLIPTNNREPDILCLSAPQLVYLTRFIELNT